MSPASDVRCLRSLLLAAFPYFRPDPPEALLEAIYVEMGDDLLPERHGLLGLDPRL